MNSEKIVIVFGILNILLGFLLIENNLIALVNGLGWFVAIISNYELMELKLSLSKEVQK